MFKQSLRSRCERSSVVFCLVVVATLLMGSLVVAAGDNAARTAESRLLQEIESGRITSAAVAIMDNGEITYAQGFGIADIERDIAAQASTLFNIGSVSKVFVTTAIMILVDAEEIHLDAPVTDYLSDFVMKDPRYRDITVRMLLNHTSGLPGTTGANSFGSAYHEAINQDVLDVLARSHLRHDPGRYAVYCNDGFTLAEIIVERVGGQSYIDFLSERVFEPLSLEDTDRSVGDRLDKNVARHYSPDMRLLPLEVVSFLGAGGLSSTAIDLVKFAEFLSVADEGILSYSALEEMKKAQPPDASLLGDAGVPYGLGWDLTNHPLYKSQGIQVLGKSGATPSYSSMLLTVPAFRLSVAVVQVGLEGGAECLAFDILDALLKDKGLLDEVTPVTDFEEFESIPQRYEAYSGYYVGAGGALCNVQFDFTEDVVRVLVYINGEEIEATSLKYRGGWFYFPDSSPSRFQTIDGRSYYIFHWLGSEVIQMERLDQIVDPETLEIDMDEKLWVRRNVKHYEGIPMVGTHLIQSSTIAALPGYVHFGGIKRVESPRFAGMPAEPIRDLRELTLVEVDGEIWAWDSYMLYSPAESVRHFEPPDTRVTIGYSGFSEWLKVFGDATVSFDVPVEGRVIVFSPDGQYMYDSIMDEKEVTLLEGSLVQLVGEPGDVFTVRTPIVGKESVTGTAVACTGSELPLDRLQSILDDALANSDIPGAILAVETPLGSWVGAAGLADLATETPMHPDMQVRIASITKPFTALTVMKLVESGVIDLEDTVEHWLPGRVPGGDQMSVRSLLNHTAGVASITDSTDFWNELLSDPLADWSNSDVIERSAPFTPVFEPGTSHMYSNTGYFLLGMIIEAVTARSVTEVMTDLIFEPVGMARTNLTRRGDMTPPFAHGYAWLPTSEEVVDCSDWNMSWDWTAGGAVTTGKDMLLFSHALFNGEIVTHETLDDMTTPSEISQGFGLGLGRVEDTALFNTTLIGHSGANPGTATIWYYFPEFETTIFVAANRQDVITGPNQVTPVNGAALVFEIFMQAWQVVESLHY